MIHPWLRKMGKGINISNTHQLAKNARMEMLVSSKGLCQ